MTKPPCYKAPCQWSADACYNCEHDAECYKAFLNYMMTGKESKKWNSEKH